MHIAVATLNATPYQNTHVKRTMQPLAWRFDASMQARPTSAEVRKRFGWPS